MTNKPKNIDYYTKQGNIYKCKYYPEPITFEAQFYLDLYYKLTATRDSNSSLDYSILTKLSEIYQLSNDDFLFLTEIIEMCENIYFMKLAETQKNQVPSK